MNDFIPPAKPIIGDDERAAVDRVLRSGMVAQGPEVAAFESEFAAHFVDGRPTVAVNSGTSGLHLGLLAVGVGAGDEVIVPSFTFAATGNSVALTGASPVFADGRIYVLSEEGVTTVFAPGKQFKALATNRLDGRTLASMAISDGAIFVRSSTHLYRISAKQ